MYVLYDAAAFLEPIGGVSRYYTEIVKRFSSDVNWTIAADYSDNAYLQSEPFNVKKPRLSFRSFLPQTHFRGKLLVYRFLTSTYPLCCYSSERINERRFLSELSAADIVHLTAPHRYDGLWKKCVGKKPTVITIVDLIPDILWKDKCICGQRRQVLDAVDHIIVISEYTKKDLIRLYGVPEDKISRIYLGYTAGTDCAHASIVPFEKYILFVGRRNGYKNFDFFFRSICPLMQDDKTLHLLCTGLPFTEKEARMIESAGVKDRVVHKYLTDEMMQAAYSNALCFVFPSKYEGFGLPTLDAFNYGCPTVLSRCSCFPEIGGDAAYYFDDGDGESLRQAVVKAMTPGAERDEKILRGRARCKMLTWEKTANETAAVYRHLLAKST